MQRLITSSLIDSMNYYKSAPVYAKRKALADFSAMVKREPRPTAPSAQRGIDFENLVCKNCNTDSNDELIEKARLLYGRNANLDVVLKMAEKCKGGEQQVKVSREIEVDGDTYFLFGYADIVFPKKIIDIKTCGKFKGADYYLNRIQHHIYSVCTGITDFDYAVADFCNTDKPWLYHEVKVQNDLAKSENEIAGKIVELKDFLHEHDLWLDYLTVFSAKKHK